jgi:peptidoglycan/LPS O-acetylase OafA/YrhL
VVTAAGNNFGGLLIHPALRCLGTISYSLYLLHGILFYLLINGLKAAGLTALPEISYWIILAIAVIPICVFCAATYRWIEFPFLSQSHKTRKATSNSTPAPEVAQSAL